MKKITRSFSYKKNLGNYQTADFFCSQEVEVEDNQDIDVLSEKIHEWCKGQVIKSVNKFIEENEPNNNKEKQELPM